jgi:alkanesulfonate monooxygenase SsuD/methylene tetrahydromethanopterin reductase-like flavin-dependent oxidoreductase (luciferase family)
MNELGFYALAGQPRSPRDLVDEVRAGEAMGLGAAFISERWNVKEAATLSGAAGAASERLGIATAATNHNTRHPAVTASFATTMHRLTGGRFTLGLGRGIQPLFDAFGIPRITTAQIEDFVGPCAACGGARR